MVSEDNVRPFCNSSYCFAESMEDPLLAQLHAAQARFGGPGFSLLARGIDIEAMTKQAAIRQNQVRFLLPSQVQTSFYLRDLFSFSRMLFLPRRRKWRTRCCCLPFSQRTPLATSEIEVSSAHPVSVFPSPLPLSLEHHLMKLNPFPVASFIVHVP